MNKSKIKTILIALLLASTANSAWAEDHYLVGGCTASGWNTSEYTRSPVAMVNVRDNVWVWSGKLTVGEGDDGRFKIPNSANGWDGYWAPAQGTILTSEWSDLSTNSSGDNKYCVAEEGIYRVTINTNTLKIKAEKVAEPSKDGDFYLIDSVDDYYWFAGQVTSTKEALKARLTADLDFAETGFFPLSCDKYKFMGEFDGSGHTMSNMVIIGSNSNLGLIRYASNGANIHDVVVEGSFTGDAKIGGIVGFARDGGEVKLTNVINKADVKSTGSSDANAAGLVGCATDDTKITATNCANLGNVSGQNGQCAAFAGWTQPGTTFTNCWNSGTISNIEGTSQLYRNTSAASVDNCYDATTIGNQGTKLDTSTIASGELCYKLNGNLSENVAWYQNLGDDADAHPYPFGTAIVYSNEDLNCNGTSKGTASYSNVEGSNRDQHSYNDWGFCSVCDEIQPDYLTFDHDAYEIGNEKQLNWFATYVNRKDRSINGRLTADIDFSGLSVMIGGDGNSTAYTGTFDGQGHKVKVDYTVSQKNVALFRTIANATIRNLITDGTINNENNSCSGGIFGGSHGSSIVSNCVSYVTFNRSSGGDATIGGIGAYMHDTGRIQDCAFYGAINAPNATGNGGLLGYANGENNIEVKNCVVNASDFTFSGSTVSLARNTGNVTNSYVVNAGPATQNEQKEATEEQLASGELCYLLNESVSGAQVWYQLIGTDEAPLPIAKENALVYANGTFHCDGTPSHVVYSNTNTGEQTAAHSFTDGICVNEHDGIVCGDANPDYLSLTDGYYELAVANHLNWFAAFVNKGHGDDAKAKLTNDIDMDGVGFPGIGNEGHNFSGEIDGQQHKLSHLVMEIDQQGVGLVSRAGVGVHLKNLTIDNTCTFTGKEGVGAFIGGAYGKGGTITIENCGNEAPVAATVKNAGSLLGCNYANDQNVVSFKNCYNTGAINSNVEGGALSGWVHNSSKVLNCYNTGTLTGCEGFIRGYGQTIDGCYSTSNTKSGEYGRAANYEITTAADGTLFATLFAYGDSNVDGSVWRFVDGENAHPVLYGNMIALSENSENNLIANNQHDVAFFRTIKTDGWNTFCAPFNMDATQIANYFGSGTEVAQLKEGTFTDDMLHFELVHTIAAGKAYLVWPGISADFTKKAIENVTITATEPTTGTTQAGYTFQGVFEPTALTANTDFIVAGGNSIVKTSGGNMKGFRAYFKGSSNARATTFVIDDTEATGIITAEGEVVMDAPVYNMQGQRVKGSTRGLYITNGKKYVVK